ncbi:MAG: flagellar motor switch protein FliN [Candidatus Hydrogenedentota bacterium]|nr:MAG: flagellar motor switch protein FliN [Candidatus Hydrogenedentota bacterium]
MAEGMLTQEEIDALLSGAALDDTDSTAGVTSPGGGTTAPAAAPAAQASPGGALDGESLKALGERLKQCMASAGETASTLIGKPITLTPISVDMLDDDGLSAVLPPDSVGFEFSLSGGLTGPAAVVLSRPEAAVIAATLMGSSEIPEGDLDELHQQAAKEGVTHLVNALTTAMGRELLSDVQAGEISIRANAGSPPPLAGSGLRAVAQYSLEIEGGGSGMLALVMDSGSARKLSGVQEKPLVQVVSEPAGAPAATSGAGATGAAGAGGGVAVQQVQFPALTPSLTEGQQKNIEILLDVSMQVTVELGRTTMMIRDILELGTGSIIELDKLAGEPVDLLVNNKLIARGEVVVIDENFGVRVTDIVSPLERIKGLQ